MSELIFISENIKALKVDYGSPLTLGYRVLGAMDPRTGKQAYTAYEVEIAQAIRLPNQMSFEFLRSVGMSVSGMDILVGHVQLLIDLDDITSGFDLRAKDTYAMYNGRKYTISKSEVYDYAAILWAKDVGVIEPSNRESSVLGFSHSISVVVE